MFLLSMQNLQENTSDEIVFKAMGRAINKTVTIVELIKVDNTYFFLCSPFDGCILDL